MRDLLHSSLIHRIDGTEKLSTEVTKWMTVMEKNGGG
jgi:hypothetical protein